MRDDYYMREWQVGDPIGDGNDIGVPDTKYMGYLRDHDGGSSKKILSITSNNTSTMQENIITYNIMKMLSITLIIHTGHTKR